MDGKILISNVEIGAAIRRRRQELSLSQEVLASKIEVSYQQVQRYENGNDRLNVEKLQLIARALTVPISYFFCRSGGAQAMRESECEHELLSHYRKIRSKGTKALVVDFARMVVQREG
jgi:transcriptional regulator with XRE-family HTH domain